MSAQRPPDQQGAGRPAELTHAEAESLISSRMDGALDPVANRALMAHLAGCSSCRAFASRMDVLSRG
ncbi:MAG: zf-HC2 domain-containing protein, partial [Thermomicrobiales bacterium]